MSADHRYMLFPLFLAGLETTDSSEKQWIDRALAGLERTSMGTNAGVVRRILNEIQYAQESATVDWVEYMRDKGWRVIIYDI